MTKSLLGTCPGCGRKGDIPAQEEDVNNVEITLLIRCEWCHFTATEHYDRLSQIITIIPQAEVKTS